MKVKFENNDAFLYENEFHERMQLNKTEMLLNILQH